MQRNVRQVEVSSVNLLKMQKPFSVGEQEGIYDAEVLWVLHASHSAHCWLVHFLKQFFCHCIYIPTAVSPLPLPQDHAASISLQKRAVIPVIGFFLLSKICHLFITLLLGETPSNFPSNLKINFLNPNETFNSIGDYYSEYTVCSPAFYIARNGKKKSVFLCLVFSFCIFSKI